MQERRHLPAGGQWRLHLSVSSRLPWQELPAKGRTLSPQQVSYFLTPSTLHPAGSIPNFFIYILIFFFIIYFIFFCFIIAICFIPFSIIYFLLLFQISVSEWGYL